MNSLKRLLIISGAVITIFGTTTVGATNQHFVKADTNSKSLLIKHHLHQTFYVSQPQAFRELNQPNGLKISGDFKPGMAIEVRDHQLKLIQFIVPQTPDPTLIILDPQIRAGDLYQVKIGPKFRQIKAEKFKFPDPSNFLTEDPRSKSN